ncbi:MAG: ATP-binding protein [Saprospiraceae bacterium]
MIPRIAAEKVKSLAKSFKAVAIIGARQSGKTTLAMSCFPDKTYVSLENPDTRNFALEDPRNFLKKYQNGAILDEVQRTPELLSYLQQILDESEEKGKFILTGSNNFLLQEKITQSLAGRAAYIDLLPFSISEMESIPHALDDLNTVMFKGGFPPVQADRIAPNDWFGAYLRTYVERDVRQIKNVSNLLLFEKMLSLCAGRIGQMLNYSNLANEIGMDVKTIQAWIGILQAGYHVFLLPPYFQNFNKRIVKTPKLYFYDTGLACYLLQISSPEQLFQHPYRGAIFENFIVSELLKNRFNQGKRSNLYFWRDSTGNEMDVVIDEGIYLHPIEIKSTATVSGISFKNIQFWQTLTGRQASTLIYGGDDTQIRKDEVTVQSWRNVSSL